MADPTTIQLNIVANATSAEQALGKLANALGRVKTAIGKGMNLDSVATGIGKIVTALSTGISEDAVSRLERAAAALNQMKGIGTVNVRVTAGSMSPINNIKDSLTQAADSAKDVRSGLEQTGDVVKDVGAKSDESAKEVVKLSDRLKELAHGSKNVKSGLGQLINQFFRIMKMRAIRYVIREITKSIKEGLDNYKEYSKAIGGSYYKAVTSANDAMLKMKNSIGAALAPAIQMLIPYIQRAVNWFINLMNIVNQFLALLNGQATWSKAVDVSSEAFEKTKDGAKGASSAIKELLADWDELNIIQSESGSGGGGGVGKEAYDYTQMFTEVGKFDEKIRKTVEWIKRNMDWIKEAAELVGLAIAGWSISTLLGGTIGTLLGWATTGVIGVAEFKINFTFDEKYIQTGDEGWLLANILTTAFGGVLAMTLMKKLTGSEGAAYAAVSIILGVSATADLVAVLGHTDVSALSKENLSLAVLAALKLGLATTFMAYAFAGMGWGSAAVVGLGATGLVFGAEVGIKAIIGDVITGEITQESVIAKAISALTIAGGTFLVATGAGFELTQAAAAAAAAAGLLITLYLGFDLALGKVNGEKISMESIARVVGVGLAAGSTYFVWGLHRGLGLSTAGMNALIAAGLAITVTLGVRAVIGQLTNPNEITIDDIVETAGAGVAAGLTLFGWLRTKGIYTIPAMQAGLAAAGAVISVIFGIRTLLVSYEDVDASGINDTVLIDTAGAAVGAALATYTWSSAHGLNMIESASNALIGAGLVATVLLGIRVIFGAVNAKEINEDTLKAALGVGAVGGLSSALVLLKGGATLAVAGAVGLGAAAAIATGIVVLAAIGIALTFDQSNITWGNEQLSQLEVQAFVRTKMFSVDADVDLALIAKQIDISLQQRNKIVEQAKKVIGTIRAVKLGIDESSSLLTMYEQISGLLGDIQEYASTQKTALTTSISLVPIFDQTGTDVSEKFLTAGLTGWQGVIDYMGGLGDQLADAMIEKTTGKLKTDWDVEAVTTIMNKVQKISEAVTGAQITSEAAAALKVQTMSLKDLTQDSVIAVLGYYVDYEKQLRDGYTKMYMSQYEQWKTQAGYYRGMAAAALEDGDEELAAAFKKEADALDDLAKKLLDNMDYSINKAVRAGGEDGRKVISDWLDAMITEPIEDAKASWVGIWSEFGGFTDPKKALQGIAATAIGIPVEALQILDITGWDYLSDDLKKKILKTLTDTFGSEQMASVLEGTGITIPVEITPEVKTNNESIFQDIMDDIEYMSKDPANLFNELVGTYGAEYYKEIITAMMQANGWTIDDILGGLNGNTNLSSARLTELVQLATQFKEEMGTVGSPDTTEFESGMSRLTESAQTTAQNIKNAFGSLNGLTIGFSGGLFGGRINVTVPRVQFMASGGFPDVGEMFIARENGMNEMIGRIGSRSAVANNDQIVNSIQGGVEAGMRNANDGTDQLLGQAVALLSQILRKTGTYQPSASHGRVIKQSLDMYARSGG